MSFSEHHLVSIYPFPALRPVLIDVGSHQGGVSQLFAQKNWKIIAFEPETKNRQVFDKNLSGFDNVTCIPKAVSNVTGDKVPFYTSQEHFGIHTLKPFHPTHKFAYEVETIRLDDALNALKIDQVTFLTIDIEGADFFALQGFDWKKYHPEVVMVEFMDNRSQPNFSYTHHDMVNYMTERGYITYISEWDVIKEYGRSGQTSEPHRWLQCVRYPLNHEPAWGNLIFITQGNESKFEQTLAQYLEKSKHQDRWEKLKQIFKKLPGVHALYQKLKSGFKSI